MSSNSHMSNATPAGLLEKLESIDSDIRFMALSDLNVLLTSRNLNVSSLDNDKTLKAICLATVDMLDDPVADVQNQAVKLLEPLVPLLNEGLIETLMTSLMKRLEKNEGDAYSITFMALRSVVGEAVAKHTVADILTSYIFQLLNEKEECSIDFLDVLIDHIKRFGSSISENQVNKLEGYLLNVVCNGRGIVRKRGAVAIGYLLRYLSDQKWNDLVKFSITGLDNPKCDPATKKILVFLGGVLAKNDPVRFKSCLNDVFARIHVCLKQDELEQEEDESEDLLEIREIGLATLEAIAGLGSDSLVDDLLTTIESFMAYDPNYNEDVDNDEDDDSADVEMDDAEDDDDFEVSDEEFSDDEDQSWKLRRYAFKLASVVVESSYANLPTIYNRLLNGVVQRISKEREDTVKLEAISTLSTMIFAASDDGPYYTSKAVRARRSSDASMKTDTDPQALLDNCADKIVKIIKSASSANVNILHGLIIKVLQNLIIVKKGLEKEQLAAIVEFLSNLSKSKSSILVDLLEAVSTILNHHTSASLKPHLTQLVEIIILGINDSYYKVSVQGLDVAVDLISLGIDDLPLLDQVQTGIISKATSNSYDLETRERAIKALSVLLGILPDSGFDSGLNVVTELLNNEALRLVAVNAVETVAKTRPVANKNSEWTILVLQSLCGFLKQSSRALRVSSLNAIRSITQVDSANGDEKLLQCFASLRIEILNHGNEVLNSVPDSQVLSIVFTILTNLIKMNLDVDNTDTSQFVLTVLKSEASVVDDNSLMELVDVLACHIPARVGLDMIKEVESLEKKQSDLLADIVSYLVLRQPNLESQVSAYQQNLQSGQNVKWSAMVLGQLGKKAQISVNLQALYAHFNSSDEGVRVACAQALGDIASTHIDTQLDEILQGLDSANLLYLTAVREIILSEQLKTSTNSMQAIWQKLFQLSNSDEGERAKVAECVGRLSILDPERFLPELQSYLTSPDWAVRITALSSVKYTFGQSHEHYDELLRPIILNFLEMVEDEKLEIRQVALSTLISAIHNKPNLVVPHLPKLLPVLHKETMIDESRVRIVQMGPFKQKFDDGLYLRKTAYETIYTLVTTLSPTLLQSIVDLGSLLERLVAGLSDEHDIKVLSCVTIGRIAGVDLEVLISAPDGGIKNIIGKFNGLLGVKVKDNAIKQEFEKQSEVIRSVQRASHQIDEVIQTQEKEGENNSLSDVELSEWNKYMAGISSTSTS